MAAIQKQRSSSKMRTCRPDQLTRQPSNISNYEGYHGGETASIPFTWELQPGTPKLKSRETTLPPLTPPPSYSYTTTPNHSRSIAKAHKKNSSSSKSNLLQSIFPKRTPRKARAPPPPPSPSLPANCSSSLYSSSSSSSSSSSYNSSSPRLRSRSVPASPMRCRRKEKEDEDEEDLYDVGVSGVCFGRGCYSSMVKKVLMGEFL